MVIANSLDPDQTLHPVVPDLDLHPLPMFFLMRDTTIYEFCISMALSSHSDWQRG